MPSNSKDPAAGDGEFLPTRSSLLFDLKNASDAVAWRRFVDNYGKMLFQVCRRTGLHEQEAEDVVQETMAAVAKQMPTFEYDRSKGSFKGWLSRVTRNHIADYLEKKTRRNRNVVAEPLTETDGANLEQAELDAVWESEWREHLLARALKRAQEVVSMQNIQIFQLSAVQQWSTQEIMQGLGVSRTQVYLARHRVGRLVAREIASLRKELE